MKLRFAAGQQYNLNPPLLTLGQRGPVHLRLPPIAPCVHHLQRPAAAHLDAVPEDLARRQFVGSKAGARIIHLQQLNCPPVRFSTVISMWYEWHPAAQTSISASTAARIPLCTPIEGFIPYSHLHPLCLLVPPASFDLIQPLQQLRQPLEDGHRPQPYAIVKRRRPGNHLACRHVV